MQEDGEMSLPSNEINIENIVNIIDSSVESVMQGERNFINCFNARNEPVGSNQFLFFIKPEIIALKRTGDFTGVIRLILRGLADFGLAIENIRVISSKYLKQYNIIADHYGVINKLSKDATGNLSEEAKSNFEKSFKENVEETQILGAFEYLQRYPDLSASGLEALWVRAGYNKLSSGTYCAKLKNGRRSIFLINGFHPKQLDTYTQPESGIIVFTLRGSVKWSAVRQDFIGNTDPLTAIPRSLRNQLLCQKTEFGITEVSPKFNGFHISAGPVEGLVELCRFNSEVVSANKIDTYANFVFGKQLLRHFTERQITLILDNATVQYGTNKITVFDLTEEMDAKEAILCLREISEQFT